MAASVAIAVPHTPMRCTRLGNGRLLNHERGIFGRKDARGDAERQRQAGAGSMARRESEEDWPWKTREQIADDVTNHGTSGSGLVAARHFAEDHGRRARENAGEAQLREQ